MPAADLHARLAIDLVDTYRGASRALSLPVPGAPDRRIEVQIPRGVRPGQLLRLAGQGGMGPNGAPPGDLYLEIEIEPSSSVAPPRVARSPVAVECRLARTLSFGEATVVFGEVQLVAIAGEVLDGDHPDVRRLDPMARLGRNEWSTLGEVLEIDRVPYGPVNPRD